MELVLKNVVDEVVVPDDAEYIAAVEDILYNETFQSMKDFPQHGSTSCLAHSIAVSYLTWHTCQKLGLNATEAARGALLHDLFLYDWHTHKTEKGAPLHGFSHPKTALENAKKEFDLTPMEEDIILKHMWPLTPVPPAYRESYIVCYHDKICSLRETMRKPLL
ncbi:HDIG domain-containing protein [Ruminococcaceae bacterium OttesenSCG-928-A11]|nr:HDIG domain-containing protein [Ruminococcaceae bacterium OttesenSCG-928-A11]